MEALRKHAVLVIQQLTGWVLVLQVTRHCVSVRVWSTDASHHGCFVKLTLALSSLLDRAPNYSTEGKACSEVCTLLAIVNKK